MEAPVDKLMKANVCVAATMDPQQKKPTKDNDSTAPKTIAQIVAGPENPNRDIRLKFGFPDVF